jgi:mono/diheme cytochrome c family protein
MAHDQAAVMTSGAARMRIGLRPLRRGSVFAAVVAASMGFHAARADAGEPARDPVARGEQLARQQCSACHVVASDQELPPLRRLPTPSFYEIANRPKTTWQSLEHFIGTTHWDMKTVPMTMPDQLLTKDERAAVSRYILSLRKH